MGGPIVRNKLFIFGDYEGTRSSAGANVLLNVPPNQVRQTCLQGLDCNLSAYSPFINGPLHDDDSNQTPFPNYTIPSADVSPQAIALLRLLPPPNNEPTDPVCASQGPNLEPVCNNFLVSGAEVLNGDQFDLRTDYNLQSSFRLFGRYSFGDFRDNGLPAFGTVAGGTGSNPAGFAGNTRTRLQGIGAGFTYSLTPRTVTDFRFGFLRYRLNNDSQDFGTIPPIPADERIPTSFPRAILSLRGCPIYRFRDRALLISLFYRVLEVIIFGLVTRLPLTIATARCGNGSSNFNSSTTGHGARAVISLSGARIFDIFKTIASPATTAVPAFSILLLAPQA